MAFDEPWKDAHNNKGSENHFGLFKTNGEAKYAIWDLVDADTFEGLTRDGNPITKSYGGDFEQLPTTLQTFAFGVLFNQRPSHPRRLSLTSKLCPLPYRTRTASEAISLGPFIG